MSEHTARDRAKLKVGSTLKRVSLKDPEGALNEVCQLFQSFNDRLTIPNLALRKRYIEGNLNILIEACW